MIYIIIAILFLISLICAGTFYWLFFKGKLYQVDVKQLIKFSLYSCVAFIVLSSMSLVYTWKPSEAIYLLTSLLLLICGIVFLLLMHKFEIIPVDRKFWMVLLTLLVFSLGGSCFIAISEYVFRLNAYQENPFTFVIFFPFLWPLLTYLTICHWRGIPKLIPAGWIYDPYYMPPDMPEGPDVVWLQVVFRVENIEYPMEISSRYRLGDAVHRTIQRSLLTTSAIRHQQLDIHGNLTPVAWTFVIEEKATSRSRQGEPLLTLENNKIANGDIIWLVPVIRS